MAKGGGGKISTVRVGRPKGFTVGRPKVSTASFTYNASAGGRKNVGNKGTRRGVTTANGGAGASLRTTTVGRRKSK